MESKYQNGKIYKIVCNETGKIYIGSTIQSLDNRLNQHKRGHKLYLQGKCNYTSSYEIIENNNYDIELICDYHCSCKKELETMEAKYIREIECINKNIPFRTDKEYREDEKNKIKEIKKKYYQQNKDRIREIEKQYREKNREKKKERDKQYREKNKDQIRERAKQHREKNKEKKMKTN